MAIVLVIIFALLAYATGMHNVYSMTWNDLECPIQLNVRISHGLLADSVGLCGYDILATRTRPVPVSLYPYPMPVTLPVYQQRTQEFFLGGRCCTPKN